MALYRSIENINDEFYSSVRLLSTRKWVGFTDYEKQAMIDILKNDFSKLLKEYNATKNYECEIKLNNICIFSKELSIYDELTITNLTTSTGNVFNALGKKDKNELTPAILIHIMKELGTAKYADYYEENRSGFRKINTRGDVANEHSSKLESLLKGVLDGLTVEESVRMADSIDLLHLSGDYDDCKQIVLSPYSDWFKEIQQYAYKAFMPTDVIRELSVYITRNSLMALTTPINISKYDESSVRAIVNKIIDDCINVDDADDDVIEYRTGSFMIRLANELNRSDVSEQEMIQRVAVMSRLALFDTKLDAIDMEAPWRESEWFDTPYYIHLSEFKSILLKTVLGRIPFRIALEDVLSDGSSFIAS